jgi:glycosyltransferase involved in cell wall biosynthesis
VRLRLVVPADVDQPTGGNVYDLAVAKALRRDGDEVELLRCEPESLASRLERPWSGHTLVDGLLACRQPEVVARTAVGVLVHMPLALQSGLSSDQVAELDAAEKQALDAATAVVATSRWAAEFLARRHALDQVAVAPPGVDRAPISLGSVPPLLVHLAALLPHKDQLGVVAALTTVRDLEWRARLAGPVDRDPEYAAAVRAAVASAGLTGRVEIPGVMDRDAAWACADLALLPSRAETFGMVVTEALARGIPAVVSEGGSVEALGETPDGGPPGAVIPAGDGAALAQVLRRWLMDEGYRGQLRQRAISRRATLEGWDATARGIRSAFGLP